MFRNLFLFRRLLATTFLVVFVHAFVGQCWCAAAGSVRPAALAKDAHACCKAKKVPTQARKAPAGHAPQAGKHDCCKDKSGKLLPALTTAAEKHLLSPAPALLPPAADVRFRLLAGPWDRTAAVRLVPPRQLKPKIPDIRIFIQSLTV